MYFDKVAFIIFLTAYFQPVFSQDHIPYRKGDQWGYCDKKKKIVIDCQFEETRFFFYELGKVKLNGKWGLTDRQGKAFLPCAYDIVYGSSKDGRVVVCVGGDESGHGGKWGFTQKYKGGEIPLPYELLRECNVDGLLAVKQHGKWGAVSELGKLFIPIQYEIEHTDAHFLANTEIPTPVFDEGNAQPSKSYLKLNFINGLSRVRWHEKWGYINYFGNAVIPCEYEYVGDFYEDLVCVVKETEQGFKTGFVNKENQAIIPIQYDFVPESYKQMNVSEGLVQVRLGGKWGYLNAQNQLIIPFQYTQANAFKEGFAAVTTDLRSVQPRWQFIDKAGKYLFQIPDKYQLLDLAFQDGFVRVRHQGKEGFLNSKGELLADLWYDEVKPFHQGIAQVVLKKEEFYKIGYINQQGKEIVPCIYDHAPRQTLAIQVGDYLKLRHNHQWGLLNTKGETILNFEYEDIALPNPSLDAFLHHAMAVKKSGKWGVVDKKQKILIPFQYEKIQILENAFVLVWYQGRKGYMDLKGTRYFED
jgi:hypothetical protein